jgi:hypothetical protein
VLVMVFEIVPVTVPSPVAPAMLVVQCDIASLYAAAARHWQASGALRRSNSFRLDIRFDERRAELAAAGAAMSLSQIRHAVC